MIALLRATALLFRMHLASILSSRRALICALLAAIPPMLAWFVLTFGPPVSAEILGGFLGWGLALQVVVPILALVGGSAVLTEEIESRTITFVFTRPIPRAALLYGRWLATLVLVCGLLGASAWTTARVISLAPPPVDEEVDPDAAWRRPEYDGEWARRHREEEDRRIAFQAAHPAEERAVLVEPMLDRFVWAVMLGGAVYSLLFAVLGVFLRHPMIFGLGYVFAFEGLLANLPGETQSLSIQFYLRSIVLEKNLLVFHELYPFPMDGFETPAAAVRMLAVVMLVALAIGGWAIGRRQYVLTA